MKSVIYIRHAKSSWKDPLLDDFDRPLNKRGLRDMKLMPRKLKELEPSMDGVISSPSLRTKCTMDSFVNMYNIKKKSIILDHSLYHPSFEYLQDVLLGVNPKWNKIMIVTHNPAITHFVNQFTKQNIANVPTSGIIRIDFMTDSWEDVYNCTSSMKYFIFPKKYNEEH